MVRLMVNIYATLGFIIISFVPTFFNPKIYDIMLKEGVEYWWAIPPDYPFKYWIGLLAVPLFVLLLFSSEILNLLKIKDTSITRPIYVFSCFFLMVLLSLFNFRWDPIYLFWGFSYGGIFGVIDGLRTYHLDFDFIANKEIVNEAKIAKLRMKYDKWFKGLSIFTGVLIALAVSGAINFLTFNPGFMGKKASSLANTGMIIELLYLGPGIGIGIFGSIFQKINKIEEQYLKIKK